MTRKKYIQVVKSKGRIYHYVRRNGKQTRLPDNPNSEEYDRAYWEAMNGAAQKAPSKRTWKHLIEHYQKSPAWRDLAKKSKESYRSYMTYLLDRIGDKDVAALTRGDALKMQAANSEKPRTANYILQVMSVLLGVAIDLGWRTDNPVKGLRKLKESGEGNRPWPEWAIEAFRKEAPEDTLLLFELALGTGQRASDLVKMKWSDFENDGIHVIQSKTKARLWVPCTSELLAVLKTTKRNGIYILTNERGQPITTSGAGQRLRKVRKRIGAEAYTLHGLRHSTASMLAELGATDAEIAAITGHSTRDMVARYSKGATQKRLAERVRELRVIKK